MAHSSAAVGAFPHRSGGSREFAPRVGLRLCPAAALTMTPAVSAIILAGIATATTTGCEPVASVFTSGVSDADFGHGSQIAAVLPASPSGTCEFPGRFYETGPVEKIDLCFPAADWFGHIPCAVGQPRFFRIRFESPRELCEDEVDALNSEVVLRGWLEGSAGLAEVQPVEAGVAFIEGCWDATGFAFGGGPWLCDDGTEEPGSNGVSRGHWRLLSAQKR